MAAEAQAQAKQLDSVTDNVQDDASQLDASKVQQAIASVGTTTTTAGSTGSSSNPTSSSSSSSTTTMNNLKGVSNFKVSKDHIAIIMKEFDGYITEDQAEKALRDVYFNEQESDTTTTAADTATSKNPDNGDSILEGALRSLITSSSFPLS